MISLIAEPHRKIRPVHPGEVLRDELTELNMSTPAFAEAIQVPCDSICSILDGTDGITGDTALRLQQYLGTTAEFWMNLQKTYELRKAEIEVGQDIVRRVKRSPAMLQ